MPANRRAVLRALGTGAATGLAGCLSILGGGTGTTGLGTDDTPDPDPWAGFSTAAEPAALTGAWPSAGNGTRNTARTTAAGPDADAGVLWAEALGSSLGNGGAAPAVVGGTVFLGNGEGEVHALDAATGEERWRFRTGKWVHSTAAVAGRTVYLGSDDFLIYALAATTGAERWSVRAGFEVSASPVVAGGRAYVGDTDGTFYALTAGGETAWQYDGRGRFVSPAAADGTVLTADGRRVIALAAADGSERWATAYPGNGIRLAVAHGTVYAATYEPAALYAFDLGDGTRRWSVDLGARYAGELAVVDDGVLAAAGDHVVAVTQDGTERWRVSVGEGATGPAVAGEVAYVSVVSGLVALGPDGTERWRLDLPGQANSPPAIAGGRLFVKRGEPVVAVE